VYAELAKKGIDHALLSLPVDASLPAELLGRKACIVELTEVYLDERAFVIRRTRGQSRLFGRTRIGNESRTVGRQKTVHIAIWNPQ
jgi:hypothetical protein